MSAYDEALAQLDGVYVALRELSAETHAVPIAHDLTLLAEAVVAARANFSAQRPVSPLTRLVRWVSTSAPNESDL